METHKIWLYEREQRLVAGPDALHEFVCTAFEVQRVGHKRQTMHEVAARLTRRNRARYEFWHPSWTLYIVTPVGEFPPGRLYLIPISEDEPR